MTAAQKRWNAKKQKTLKQPLHKRSMKNAKILAVYKATMCHVSLHLWVDHSAAKLVDRMTAKLVVVNLIKFHLTKLKQKL